MKRCFLILLSLVLIFSTMPVFADSPAVSAMGNFQGRLLAEDYDAVYDLNLKNNTAAEQKVMVILAKYSGNTLKQVNPEVLTLAAGERLSKSYTVTDITREITSVRAFVLDSSDRLRPMIRADELNKEYGSIYNNYATHNTVSTVTEGVLDKATLNTRFPVHESFRTRHQKYTINGGSMLAYFETAPEEIYVALTQRQSAEGATSFTQFRTARVIDPVGKVVCYYDFSAEGASDGVVFDVPEYDGDPGIWTISYVGGQYTGDEVTIGIPETSYYGIRGDMVIGLNHKTMQDSNGNNRTWYVYVPESCVGAEAAVMVARNDAGTAIGKRAVLPVITKADGTVLPELIDANGNLADIDPYMHATLVGARIAEADADTVWSFALDWDTYFYRTTSGTTYQPNSASFAANGLYVGFVNGLPGLLCPTEEAARFLKGGSALSSDNRVLGGSLQAKARDIMLDIVNNNDLTLSAEFVKEIPESVRESGFLGVEALIAANPTGVANASYLCEKQNLNTDDIYLGSLSVTEFENAANGLTYRPNFENFSYTSAHRDYYSAADLSAFAGLPTKLNALYGNTALVYRAALAMLTHVVEMSPEHLLRSYGLTSAINRDAEGNITTENFGDYWPCERCFFTFPNLAQAYNLLKDKVSPEVEEVMRNGLMLIGDKLVNYQANDTNQWSEIIMGQLEIYLATGEERFLEYFERAAVAVTDLPASGYSTGQNEAGAFLERNAPSPQYGDQALHNLYPCYYAYRKLKNADSVVLEALEDGMARYSRWESLNFLPAEEGGDTFSPNAIVVKGKNANYGADGGTYPNFSYSSVAFPVSNTLYQYRKHSFSTSTAGDMLYRMPELGEALLEQKILNVDDPTSVLQATRTNYSSTRSYEIFTQEEWTEETETLPVFETDKMWLYDDLLAWKKNGLYTMTFYANPHSVSPNVTTAAMSCRGGLPFAVWSEGTGPVVLSQHTNYSNIAFAGDETAVYSGVFVTLADGTAVDTGKTNSIITEQNENGYTITQPLARYTSLNSEGDEVSSTPVYGTLTYEAAYTDTGYSIDVSFSPSENGEGYTEAYIVLPIFSQRTGAYYTSADTGTLHSVITQSQDKKTLNYQSTGQGAYGSMNIHSSTAATLDETKYYGSYGKNVIQRLIIPLDNDGKATLSFEIAD